MLKSIIFLALSLPCFGSLANVYYANTSAGGNTGIDCADAYAWTDATNGFNIAGKWGSGSTQIGAGTTAHICGTITGANQANGFTFQGSGSSGNPVTLKFETGAVLVSPSWGTSESNHTGAIIAIGVSYVTIDFGTNGTVYNSLNGTTGGMCPGGTCVENDSALIVMSACSNCIVQSTAQGGNIGPVYTRTSNTDTENGWGGINIWIDGTSNNVNINNVTVHDGVALIWRDLTTSGTSSGLVVSNTNLYNTSTALALAQGSGSNGVSDLTFFGNLVHDFALYNDHSTYANHHDGIHVFAYGTALTSINVYDNTWYGDFGSGTAWIYYEQYASGTGTINIFNNLFDFQAVPDPNLGAGGSRTIEFEGNAITAKVYDNTIYGLNAANTIASGIYNNGTTLTGDIRNNIIGGYLEELIEGALPAASTNNNVYDFGGGATLAINASTYNAASFSSWRTACSCDAASSTTAPNLNSSYKIQNTSSSAYQLGQNLTGNPSSLINADYAGNARPSSGSWDAGAYQYQASGSGGTTTGAGVTTSGNVTKQLLQR